MRSNICANSSYVNGLVTWNPSIQSKFWTKTCFIGFILCLKLTSMGRSAKLESYSLKLSYSTRYLHGDVEPNDDIFHKFTEILCILVGFIVKIFSEFCLQNKYFSVCFFFFYVFSLITFSSFLLINLSFNCEALQKLSIALFWIECALLFSPFFNGRFKFVLFNFLLENGNKRDLLMKKRILMKN